MSDIASGKNYEIKKNKEIKIKKNTKKISA